MPHTYEGYLTFSEFGGQTRLRFRVAREATSSGRVTAQVKNYEVIAMAVPNFSNTEDMINALAGRWTEFCVPAFQGGAEAALDEAARLPILSTIRTAWNRVSVITNPDERTHIVSIVRIRYP